MIPTLKHYSDIVSDILPSASIYYIFILTLFLTFYLTFFLAFYLTFSLWRLAEVRQCPLRSGARSWDPEVPTEIWSLRLRYGSAHSSSGARGWGPAVPTELELSSGNAPWDLELVAEGGVQGRRWRRARGGGARDPHLAGWEKDFTDRNWIYLSSKNWEYQPSGKIENSILRMGSPWGVATYTHSNHPADQVPI